MQRTLPLICALLFTRTAQGIHDEVVDEESPADDASKMDEKKFLMDATSSDLMRREVILARSFESGLLDTKAAMDNAIETLGAHPELEEQELEKWADFYRSVQGGELQPKPAADEALQVLKEPHPELEELEKWADFYRSSEGGHLDSKAAVAEALQMLMGARPEMKDADGAAQNGNHPVVTPPKSTNSKAVKPTIGKSCTPPQLPEHGNSFGQPCKEISQSAAGPAAQIADGATCTTQCKLPFIPEPPSLTCVDGSIEKYVCKKNIDIFELSCWAKCQKEHKNYRYTRKNLQVDCQCHGKSTSDVPPEHLRPEPEEPSAPRASAPRASGQGRPPPTHFTQELQESRSGAHAKKHLDGHRFFWVSLVMSGLRFL